MENYIITTLVLCVVAFVIGGILAWLIIVNYYAGKADGYVEQMFNQYVQQLEEQRQVIKSATQDLQQARTRIGDIDSMLTEQRVPQPLFDQDEVR